jgi:DNA (cytosine-5)-methyltransferase 1
MPCRLARGIASSTSMKRPRTRRLTVLSAFTGAGGLDLGLDCAGFETVACIEQNVHARATIQRNRPDWKLLDPPDILDLAAQLTPADLGLRPRGLAVLAGGPPCQPFSTAAQWAESGRSGITDPRSLTLVAFLEIAERFLPAVIFIENVPGFVQGRTSALSIIEDELRRINSKHGTRYRLEHRVLQAADYGVPQRRRRAILVVRRDGREFRWPVATHAGAPVRAFDALIDVEPAVLPRATGQWADLLPSIPAGKNYQYHTTRGEGEPLFGHRSWFWSFLLKLAPDQPAWTIPAQAGPATGPFHWENRPLAVEELARLQSFPSEWRFEGGYTAQERQIGNATPPLLSEVIGRAIAEQVFGALFHEAPSLQIARQPAVPQPPAPTPVPERFLGRRGTQPDHPGVGAGPGALRRRVRELRLELAELLVLRMQRLVPTPEADPLHVPTKHRERKAEAMAAMGNGTGPKAHPLRRERYVEVRGSLDQLSLV